MLDGGCTERYLDEPHTLAPMRSRRIAPVITSLLACAVLTACIRIAPAGGGVARPTLVAEVDGFSGPEAVRYDPDQDIFFVANFNGPGSRVDDDGFISRMRPDGTVEQLRFIAGGVDGVTLHAPRGMVITGDTLWAVDVDAMRGFNRRTGAPLATISFAGTDVGFLNDITQGPDGALYVTDTGRNRIHRIEHGRATLALSDTLLGGPNGITWDHASADLIVVSWNRPAMFAWLPGTSELRVIGESATGRRFDGVEVRADGSILVASQADSSIHVFRSRTGEPLFHVQGAPADIAWDSRRNRVAVPYIARNRVEIFQLP